MPVATFSGIASGIDTKSLIAASVEAEKALKVTPKEEKKTTINEETDALKELKTQLEDFRLAMRDLSTISGGGIAKKGISSDEATVVASATNGAANGTYALTVNKLANNATFSFNDRFSSDTAIAAPTLNNALPATNRTLSFTVGSAPNQENINIVLTNTTTVSDIVNQFNSATSKATAKLINVGTTASPSYALTINSNNPGLATGALNVSVGSGFTTNLNSSSLIQANDAEFSLAGISGTITRPSNTISDITPGITLQLTGVGAASINVSSDSNATATKLSELVKQYNSIVKYVKENDLITIEENDNSTQPVYGSLTRANVDDDVVTTLRNAISNTTAQAGKEVRILADLGITTERDGTLKFDETKFQEAIGKDPTGVEELITNFADTNSAIGGPLHQYTQFQGILDNAIESNDNSIRDLNNRIADAESSIARLEQSLTARFARLEATMGKMQGQQQSLLGALSGLK
jgi:flagellar hook-associated protein 2